MLLRYEDRLADPAGTLRRALDFARIEVEPAVVNSATDATRFERLRETEDETGFAERP